jgi:glycosyltransferase involved in cell wall biosynthesis
MRHIILHDYFESLDGGGKLSSILAQGLELEIGYGFARPGHAFLPASLRQVDLGAHSALPLWRQIKLARAFERRTDFLRAYHGVIYSGFYSPLAVARHTNGPNVLYCHTPPRFLYDQRDFYLASLSPPLRPLLRAFIADFQPRYERAVSRMDLLIANSDNVRRRIQRYLGQDAQVIYPPCDTARFTWQGQGDYYLSTARLDPLKRVDTIVRAFLEMPDKRLIVASGGAELARLRRLARNAPNIRFTGWLSEREMHQLVGRAIAILYLPKDEDFGMSPVEAMAAGKPVIGVAEGGLLETVIPGETGLLLKADFSVEDIRAAVEHIEPGRALSMRPACEARAQCFRNELFLARMREILHF